MSYNILSKNIGVFPSTKRNDIYDRNARLNSEQNLISLVNRLTGIKSFKISGISLSAVDNNHTLYGGKCNINGYLFDIKDSVFTINSNNITNGHKAYLKLKIKPTTATGFILDEIAAGDDYNGSDITDANYNSSTYKGIELIITTADQLVANDADGVYTYLEVATWNATDKQWVNSDTTMSYIAGQIRMRDNFYSTNANLNHTQEYLHLDTYLNDYYVIDDGNLDEE